MPPDARGGISPLSSGRRCLLAVSLTFPLTALLSSVAPPPVHAQDNHEPTDNWVDGGGTVLVSVDAMNAATRPTLTIREGESATYWLKLSGQPPAEAARDDPWWVMVHIDGAQRADGEYDSIRLTPSIGREFHTGNWNQWLGIKIDAEEDGDDENETYAFTHELRDHDSYCPPELHGIAALTVRVIDDDGPNAPRPELSIGDASVEEGGTARFTVTLDTESENPVTVRYRTSNGTARAGSDYDAADDTLSVPAETKTAFIDVQTTEDDDYEADETFTVRLSSPVGATIGEGTGDGTIEDDDDEPGLSIADVTVEEGRTAEFEVTLDASSHVPVTVRYATMDGSAIDGSDYTATSGTLTFSPGTGTRTIRVSTREDQAKEPEEAFTVELSDPDGATIDDDTGIGTITDDDEAAPPSLRIEDTTVPEGGTASFMVTLSVSSDETVTVEYETRDGKARADSDYTAKSGTVTFPANSTEQTVEVETLQDDDYEGNEEFTVRLSNPDEATLDAAAAEGTIEDDDDPPQVFIENDVTVDEGDTARFVVKLSATSILPVRVHYATMEDTALEGTDYAAAGGTLTFQPGQDSKTVDVRTRQDTADEPDTETFTLELSDPRDASLGSKDTATGTITDDDDPPEVTIGDAPAVTEGSQALFPVRLNVASGKMVAVMYRTVDGTAEAGSDYVATSGTLEFEPGDTRLTIAVPTTDDGSHEEEENFKIELHDPTAATLKNDPEEGEGTIRDNDDPLHLSIADAEAVSEGGTATFTVTLSEESSDIVTVEYATRDGTARADSDYTADSGTLTFSAGDTEETVSVSVLDDDVGENLESFTVVLSSASGANIRDGSGSVTIIDDDEGGTPSLRIGDTSVTEGGTAEFTVTLSIPAPAAVTVEYGTVDGSAVAGLDYTTTTATLTFSTGDETKTISVPTRNDQVAEQTEHFMVELRNPTGATLADRTGRGTITDDDTGRDPGLAVFDAQAVREGGTALFRVRLSTQSSQSVTVAYRTVDGTAEAGTDYTANQGNLQFAPGTVEQTIVVHTLNDGATEPTETFMVELSSASNATLERDTATGTIEDDDEGGGDRLPTLSIEDAGTVAEGDPVEFVVTLSARSDLVVTVKYETRSGTATAGSDFTSTEGTLRFEPGDREEKIAVPTLEDDTPEETEAFTVRLNDPEHATVKDGTATARIIDRGSLPTLAITDAAPVAEGDTAEFVVTLSPASEQPVTVAFTTEDGSAVDGSDYTAKAGTLRFEAGDKNKTITVSTVDDSEPEETETFTVKLNGPSGATLADDTGTGTITDNDGGGVVSLPAVSITDAPPVTEGDTAEFAVTLSRASGQAVTVAFATADGTARVGTDYTRTAGALRFEPGVTAQTIQVRVLDDEILEQTEHFTVELSDPAGATLEDGSGTGTITDNDEGRLPALAVDDAAPVIEGSTALFPVTLSAPSEQVVTVAFATADGTATSGADYTGASGSLTFEPGATRQSIEVATLDDEAEEEPEEQFKVTLSEPSGATLEDDSGTGTIRDDDGDTGDFPTLSIADAPPVVEGRTAEFLVTLGAAVAHVVTAAYATADGTAKANLDYTSTTGTLRLEPGDIARAIRVPTLDDEALEQNEDFTVTLSSPAGASLADAVGRGTIADDDEGKLPALAIGDAPPVIEGETSRFPVTLSAPSERTVTVEFATADRTAAAGSDYVATDGTLTFEPGTTRRTIEVVTRQDEFVESEEGFSVTLSDPTGVGLEDDTGMGTILDDDRVENLPTLAIADAPPVPEGGTAGFVATLSPASEQVVSVSYRTLDGTAVAGLDYTAAEGTLSFEPGETTRTVAVTTLTDELVEGPERFTVELSDSVAAVVTDASGVGTITETAERIAAVNRTVLPELGRALASAATCRFDRGLSGPTYRGGPPGRSEYLSLSHGLTSAPLTSAPLTSVPLTSAPPGSDPRLSPMHERSALERALGDSSFLMPMREEEGGPERFAAWGCGGYRHLGGGGNAGVAWNGEAFSLSVGADVRLGSNTLAGLSVSRSRGSFDYRAGGSSGEAGGSYDLRLTGVHPYIGWSVLPDLDVWSMAGRAWGTLRIEDDLAAGPLVSAATLNSGAVGATGRLLARGGTSLTLKGEGALARLGIAGDGGLVEALAVDMRRLRLGTEASHDLLFSSGASLTPWGELGLRHDGGDGETGAGLEVGGGLRYRNLAGWTTEGYGRWLAAHAGALREWGFGAVLGYDPGASGRGPSVSLMPGWGDTASGVQRLWERGATDPTVPATPGSRLDAQFGYGFAAFRGRGVLTPFGTVSLDREYGRGYRLGSRLAVGRATYLSLEAERRERAAAAAVHAIMLRGALRF